MFIRVIAWLVGIKMNKRNLMGLRRIEENAESCCQRILSHCAIDRRKKASMQNGKSIQMAPLDFHRFILCCKLLNKQQKIAHMQSRIMWNMFLVNCFNSFETQVQRRANGNHSQTWKTHTRNWRRKLTGAICTLKYSTYAPQIGWSSLTLHNRIG